MGKDSTQQINIDCLVVMSAIEGRQSRESVELNFKILNVIDIGGLEAIYSVVTFGGSERASHVDI